MYYLASHINTNHFVIILFLLLNIATIIAYANAKTKLFTFLKNVTMASTVVLAIAFCNLNTVDVYLHSLQTPLAISQDLQEQTGNMGSSLVVTILEIVKNAF